MNPVYLVTRAVRLILRVENCATCLGVQSGVDFPTTYIIVIIATKRFSSRRLHMLKEMPWRVGEKSHGWKPIRCGSASLRMYEVCISSNS